MTAADRIAGLRAALRTMGRPPPPPWMEAFFGEWSGRAPLLEGLPDFWDLEGGVGVVQSVLSTVPTAVRSVSDFEATWRSMSWAVPAGVTPWGLDPGGNLYVFDDASGRVGVLFVDVQPPRLMWLAPTWQSLFERLTVEET